MGKRKEASTNVPAEGSVIHEGEWLIDVIDTLASEYHWSKKDILETIYPEEVEPYTRKIGERKKWEALNKVQDYRVLLEATVAPHTEKGIGVRQLNESLDKLERMLKNPLDKIEEANNPIMKAMEENRHLFG